jgi:hypothetical protein
MPSDNLIKVTIELAFRGTQSFRERPKCSHASRVEQDEQLVTPSDAGFKRDVSPIAP